MIIILYYHWLSNSVWNCIGFIGVASPLGIGATGLWLYLSTPLTCWTEKKGHSDNLTFTSLGEYLKTIPHLGLDDMQIIATELKHCMDKI